MFDPTGRGSISAEQYQQALLSLGIDTPVGSMDQDRIDRKTFATSMFAEIKALSTTWRDAGWCSSFLSKVPLYGKVPREMRGAGPKRVKVEVDSGSTGYRKQEATKLNNRKTVPTSRRAEGRKERGLVHNGGGGERENSGQLIIIVDHIVIVIIINIIYLFIFICLFSSFFLPLFTFLHLLRSSLPKYLSALGSKS
jgi:hypothetical protein